MSDQLIELAAQIHRLCEELPDDGNLVVIGDPPALSYENTVVIRELLDASEALWTYARACQVRADLQRLKILPECCCTTALTRKETRI